MTSARLRLLAAVPVLGLALASVASPAHASLPTDCAGYVDVVLGTPKANVERQVDAGQVVLVFESNDSTFSNPADLVITERAVNGDQPPQAGSRFGASVAWGFEDASPGCSMVAIGAPGADGGRGRVYVFVVDEDGIVPGSIQVLTQNTSGVPDVAEAGDGFGSSLLLGGEQSVSWLAVGSPNEDIGSRRDAGMVHVFPYPTWGTGSVAYRQGAGRVPDTAEAGDHFGSALGFGRNVWSLWVGVPDEDYRGKVDTGAVVTLPGSYSSGTGAVRLPGTVGGLGMFTQNSSGVPDVNEGGDRFGSVLSALVGTQSSDRQPVIGVPGENIGSISNAGAITVAYQDRTWALFRQGAGGVDGPAEAGDRFGASLSVDTNVLLIGAPGESLRGHAGAGQIHRMTALGGVPKLSGAREQSISQNTSGVNGSAESGDAFGTAVAFSVNGAVVGVPGQNVSGVVDAGMIAFFPWNPGSTTRALAPANDVTFVMGSKNFPGAPQSAAGFGSVANSVSQ